MFYFVKNKMILKESVYWTIIFDVIYDLLEGKEGAQELRTTLCRI